MLEKLSESDSFSGEHRQVMIWVWTLLQAACGGRELEESVCVWGGDSGQSLAEGVFDRQLVGQWPEIKGQMV